MVLGQSAGVAAAMAIDSNSTVQEINVKGLIAKLMNDPYLDGSTPEILVDEGEIDKIDRSLGWTKYYGGYKYSHMLAANKQRDMFFTFTPIFKKSGFYDLYFFCTSNYNVSNSLGLRVKHSDGEDIVYIKPKENVNLWTKVGSYHFTKGKIGSLTIDGSLSEGPIYADAILLVPTDS